MFLFKEPKSFYIIETFWGSHKDYFNCCPWDCLAIRSSSLRFVFESNWLALKIPVDSPKFWKTDYFLLYWNCLERAKIVNHSFITWSPTLSFSKEFLQEFQQIGIVQNRILIMTNEMPKHIKDGPMSLSSKVRKPFSPIPTTVIAWKKKGFSNASLIKAFSTSEKILLNTERISRYENLL